MTETKEDIRKLIEKSKITLIGNDEESEKEVYDLISELPSKIIIKDSSKIKEYLREAKIEAILNKNTHIVIDYKILLQNKISFLIRDFLNIDKNLIKLIIKLSAHKKENEFPLYTPLLEHSNFAFILKNKTEFNIIKNDTN